MFNQFENGFNQFEQNIRNKTYQIKYSREYLDLKDDLKAIGEKTSHIYQTDIKSAVSNFSDLAKKIVFNKSFRQLIRVKS
jgi:hypothetical protein